MSYPKTFRLMLAEGAFPELSPGDCLMVTVLQRPGFGEAPFVELETNPAYPQGLEEGPFNAPSRAYPEALLRARKLQLRSLVEELGGVVVWREDVEKLAAPREETACSLCGAFPIEPGHACTVDGS